MKNFKSLFLLLSCATFSSLQAQDCEGYFPSKEGTTFEITHFDAKGKLSSKDDHKIISITHEGGTTTWTDHVISYDAKGKENMNMDLSVSCSDGKVTFDMRHMMPSQQAQGMENMEMTIEGGDLTFPNNAQPGQTLPDGFAKFTFGTGGMTIMSMTIEVTNRKVEARENITVPAGTFDCLRISEDVSVKMLTTMKGSSKSWYSRGTGLVREESYDAKGNLSGHSELTKFAD